MPVILKSLNGHNRVVPASSYSLDKISLHPS